MIKAIFIDFYGTVVHEDGKIIADIAQKMLHTGTARSRSEITEFWWKNFQNILSHSHGDTFKTQREIEYEALEKTVVHFQSSINIKEACALLFDQWRKPPIFPESKIFFERSPLPVYIVSNIDRNDICEAVKFHGLVPNGIYTSEDARSYKPRKELFEHAMRENHLNADEIIHIGDSWSCDVCGAEAVGIKAILINRIHKELPHDTIEIKSLLEAYAFL